VNQLKFGVLLFGILGLVGVFLPQDSLAGRSITFWDTASTHGQGIHVYLVIAAYAVAALIAIVAMASPPMQRWHAVVAFVSFVFVLVKFRYVLPFDIFKQGIGAKLLGVAAFGGALVSGLALLKPESPR
jgi:hypothetical protein